MVLCSIRSSIKFLGNLRFFSLTSNGITKIVDPNSNISIKSGFNLSIKPYDLLDCPESNKIRATFLPNPKSKKGLDISEQIEIIVKNKNVHILDNSADTKKDNLTCLIEIPVKSNLNIESHSDVEIIDMYSDCLKAIAHVGSIYTKNLRTTSVDLATINGNIECKGLTLAQKMEIQVKEMGNILLDKLQGDVLYCKVFNGNIRVNSSYVENSNFSCEVGNLYLKNIHKSSEIYILKQGNIEMTGIHGKTYINSKAGDLNLQFSEIHGDNFVLANKSKNVVINFSDIVELSTYIDIHSDKIEMDESVNHLVKHLLNNKQFKFGDKNLSKKLMVCSSGLLKLGKMSWADSIKLQMGLA